MDDLFQAVATQPGGTGILVNNAAIYPMTPFLDISPTEYDDVHAVNQRGYWLCAQCAARQMAEAGGGAIVNVASIAMHGGWDGPGGLRGDQGRGRGALTRALARESGRPASGSTRSPLARSRPRPNRSTMTRPPIAGTSSIISR